MHPFAPAEYFVNGVDFTVLMVVHMALLKPNFRTLLKDGPQKTTAEKAHVSSSFGV